MDSSSGFRREALMQSGIADLMVAFQMHQITPAEFADALSLLPPGEAQIAVKVLSNLWLHDAVRDGDRRRARNLCQVLRLRGLPLN